MWVVKSVHFLTWRKHCVRKAAVLTGSRFKTAILTPQTTQISHPPILEAVARPSIIPFKCTLHVSNLNSVPPCSSVTTKRSCFYSLIFRTALLAAWGRKEWTSASRTVVQCSRAAPTSSHFSSDIIIYDTLLSGIYLSSETPPCQLSIVTLLRLSFVD